MFWLIAKQCLHSMKGSWGRGFCYIFLPFTLPLSEVCKGWNTTSRADLDWPKGYPYHLTLCSAIKAQESVGGGGICVVMVFVSSSSHYICWVFACQQVPGHLPADGKQWINSLLWFACMRSFTSLKITILTHKFSLSYPAVGNKWVTGWGLGC